MKKLSEIFLYGYLMSLTIIELVSSWFNKLIKEGNPVSLRKPLSDTP